MRWGRAVLYVAGVKNCELEISRGSGPYLYLAETRLRAVVLTTISRIECFCRSLDIILQLLRG